MPYRRRNVVSREAEVEKAESADKRARFAFDSGAQRLPALISDQEDVYCSLLWELDILQISEDGEKSREQR